ncbi:hypothetical protein FOC1_g10006597 [Fusarium oxysporum f. sp. cubense race 1]|uniref:Uncharacterized protein n=1 Tax=Fusarium oxysporum f. sp. cubense (strain race 1) TaxID=1229664 RepID=N4ULI5_FUSC1|nr:hypothetical protein FOC1_g10006597 [Fusarium oxysporum f. sp. cubense race 1]
MRRCAIVINNGQSGHNYPVTVVNYYLLTGPPTQINDIDIEEIPSLHSFLRRRKITSKDLPHVDKLQPIQQVNKHLAIFDCQVRLHGTTLNASIIGYITGQMEALKDLADRLERGQGVSRQQQAFINRTASGGGNGPYWAWFMELKCAVQLVELTV